MPVHPYETDRHLGSPGYRSTRCVTSRHVLLAQALAGGSGRVTEALLLKEVARTITQEFPGRGTTILEVKAAVLGEVQEGNRLHIQITPRNAMPSAKGRAHVRVDIRTCDELVMLAHVTVGGSSEYRRPRRDISSSTL